jgi:hypothetical protein
MRWLGSCLVAPLTGRLCLTLIHVGQAVAVGALCVHIRDDNKRIRRSSAYRKSSRREESSSSRRRRLVHRLVHRGPMQEQTAPPTRLQLGACNRCSGMGEDSALSSIHGEDSVQSATSMGATADINLEEHSDASSTDSHLLSLLAARVDGGVRALSGSLPAYALGTRSSRSLRTASKSGSLPPLAGDVIMQRRSDDGRGSWP